MHVHKKKPAEHKINTLAAKSSYTYACQNSRVKRLCVWWSTGGCMLARPQGNSLWLRLQGSGTGYTSTGWWVRGGGPQAHWCLLGLKLPAQSPGKRPHQFVPPCSGGHCTQKLREHATKLWARTGHSGEWVHCLPGGGMALEVPGVPGALHQQAPAVPLLVVQSLNCLRNTQLLGIYSGMSFLVLHRPRASENNRRGPPQDIHCSR